MIRAFKLEWLKLKHYRVFWILFGLYLLAQLIITNGGVFFLEWLKSKDVDFDGIDPTIVPIYDFPDIWQNSVWLASFVKVLISFIVIVSVNNELSYNTLRQNIIDGVSKREFLLSKLSLILFLAGVCTLVLFSSGMIAGLIYSHVTDLKYIFDEMEFLLAYFIQLVVFSLFAFSLAMVIKKAGFAIVFTMLYSLVFEPIITSILEFAPFAKGYTAGIVKFFPIYSMEKLSGKIYESPFARYFFQEIKDYVLWYEWLIAIGWGAFFMLFITWILNKKDLKG
ncbi:MAG: ABC transporter permease [Ekhidna sp.]|uniref:ABC transporter permease n=1 Tax=Ekhidna sp. TaxID=2608089 RepID=UPI0032EDADF4